MELLSRLTGDPSFGNAAKLASRALWLRRSLENSLFGKHIDVETGRWTETLSGLGSNSDSFYEYLLKHYILYPEDFDFFELFHDSYIGIFNNTRSVYF
jgi:mannosidase alpha-like ER degradation enhancer 2